MLFSEQKSFFGERRSSGCLDFLLFPYLQLYDVMIYANDQVTHFDTNRLSMLPSDRKEFDISFTRGLRDKLDVAWRKWSKDRSGLGFSSTCMLTFARCSDRLSCFGWKWVWAKVERLARRSATSVECLDQRGHGSIDAISGLWVFFLHSGSCAMVAGIPYNSLVWEQPKLLADWSTFELFNMPVSNLVEC